MALPAALANNKTREVIQPAGTAAAAGVATAAKERTEWLILQPGIPVAAAWLKSAAVRQTAAAEEETYGT
jgi:hypothetical protein